MREDNHIRKVLKDSLSKSMLADMEMVSRGFNTVIEKYSFLFEGDMLEAQKTFIEACFPPDEPIVHKSEAGGEGVVHFNIDHIVDSLPNEMKQILYDRLIQKFIETTTIDDLKE